MSGDARFTLGEPSKWIRWNDPAPTGVGLDAVCMCAHDAGWHTIRGSGLLGHCHGPRWLGLFGRCRCHGFILRAKRDQT